MNDSNSSPPASGKKPLAVYTILDRGERPSFWMKIGAAFRNRDGSISLVLDALPVGTNRLQIREQRDPAERAAAQANGASAEAAEARP